MRIGAEAGVDVVELATKIARPGDCGGYFTLLEKDAGALDSMGDKTQREG